jgi:hypothetical protein
MVARRPLYPVTPGETAIDRLLNQTLPQIVQQEMQRAERNEAREREDLQFKTRMMYQAQRDDIEDRRNYNRDVAPYLEGVEVAINNRDSKSLESNLNIYEMYVNDPENAKFLGPDAKSKLTTYKATLKNLGDANTKAQGYMDTLNNPQASQDDTTAAYKWMLQNKDTYSLTLGTDFSAIMNNKEFMESGRYTGVRILNRSPKMAMDIETLYQNSVGSAIKTYDKAVSTEDLEAYAKYLPVEYQNPILGTGPNKLKRDSLLREAYEQYGRPQYIAAGQEFFNSFDDLFVSKEGKNLYLENASDTEKNDIFEKLVISKAMANSNSPNFRALQTGAKDEKLTKFGNIFLSDAQIDQIEAELIQSGIDAKHFGIPEAVIDNGDGDDTVNGDGDDLKLGPNDVRLAEETIENKITKSIDLGNRAKAIVNPEKFGERDINGNIVAAPIIERSEALTESENALAQIIQEKAHLDRIAGTRNYTPDEIDRLNSLTGKLKIISSTENGRKAIRLFEKGGMTFFNQRAIISGNNAVKLQKAIGELDALKMDNEIIRQSLNAPGDKVMLIGPTERNVPGAGEQFRQMFNIPRLSGLTRKEIIEAQRKVKPINYKKDASAPTESLRFGKVYSRSFLENVLKQRNKFYLASAQKKVDKLQEKYESGADLLSEFLLVNSVNEDTKELINQYFILK